jgi:hypothetical protein
MAASTSLTPAERALRARLASHASWARTADRTARSQPARDAIAAKFLAEADGDELRAASLRKAHFARLAFLSAKARRRKAGLASTKAGEAEAAEAAGGDPLDAA